MTDEIITPPEAETDEATPEEGGAAQAGAPALDQDREVVGQTQEVEAVNDGDGAADMGLLAGLLSAGPLGVIAEEDLPPEEIGAEVERGLSLLTRRGLRPDLPTAFQIMLYRRRDAHSPARLRLIRKRLESYEPDSIYFQLWGGRPALAWTARALGLEIPRPEQPPPRVRSLTVHRMDLERFVQGEPVVAPGSRRVFTIQDIPEGVRERLITTMQEAHPEWFPERGGPGSGHFGHKGRPGQRGGSLPDLGPMADIVAYRLPKESGSPMGYSDWEVGPSFEAAMRNFQGEVPDWDNPDAWDYIQIVPKRDASEYYSGNFGCQAWRHKETGITVPDFCRQSGGWPEMWHGQDVKEAEFLKIHHESPVFDYIVRGGPGSGHFGHEGRPGQVGGSRPSDGGQELAEGQGDYQTPPGEGLGHVPDFAEAQEWRARAQDTGYIRRSKTPRKIIGVLMSYFLQRPVWANYETIDKVSKSKGFRFRDDQGNVLTVQMGENSRLSPNWEEELVMSWIDANNPGTGMGTAFMRAVRQYATAKGQPFRVVMVTNIPFYQRFDWLEMVRGGVSAEFVYQPERVVERAEDEREVEGDQVDLSRPPHDPAGKQWPPPLSAVERGGPGSGHHGHKGRPGQVGGSAPSGEGQGLAEGQADYQNLNDLAKSIRSQAGLTFGRGRAEVRVYEGLRNPGLTVWLDVPDRRMAQTFFDMITEDLADQNLEPLGELNRDADGRWKLDFSPPHGEMGALTDWLAELEQAQEMTTEPVEVDGAGSRPGPEVEVEGSPTEGLRLSKTRLNEIIAWSSSRYTERKKAEVVAEALDILKGEQWELVGEPGAQDRPESQEMYRSWAGSETPQFRQREYRGRQVLEIRVDRRIFSSGAYATGAMARTGTYLVNGPDGYVAEGRGDEVDTFEPRRIWYFSTPLVQRGGPGSGHFGHEGRPGEVGGSRPADGGGGEIAEGEGDFQTDEDGRVMVGITSARPGKEAEQVFDDMRQFHDRLVAMGLRNVSVQPGLGGWEGGQEPTWVVEYEGDGEALKMLAQLGKQYDQDAVLIMEECPNGSGCDPVVEFEFSDPVIPEERELVTELLTQNGVGGWTWYRKRGGFSVLRAVNVSAWGGDPQQHLMTAQRLAQLFDAAGMPHNFRQDQVMVQILEREGENAYDRLLEAQS